VFLNGSYSGMVNTRALELSGLLGEPGTSGTTGIIRPDVFPLLPLGEGSRPDTTQYAESLESMLHRYNSVGITGVTDGMVGGSEMTVYQKLKDEDRLTVRVNMCVKPKFDTEGANPEDIISDLAYGAEAIKIFLDGGFLTGTAAMIEPWGEVARGIFGFQENEYHGTLNYTQDQVTRIAVAVVKKGRKFTAHCVGDRALDILLTAFEAADEIREIRTLRWSVIHGNFFAAEAIDRANKLGIVIECQIAWFYKDAPYVERVLGRKYLECFMPLRTMRESGLIISGGSDHMVKFDSRFSINPYNPFLSLQAMVTRTVEEGRVMTADESISREDALRCYTINGAYATGEESDKGSIEPGKLADMVILDSNYLECHENNINEIQALTTVFGGKVVYEREAR
ncbi:MAG: amidohydrolase family protein, partial [Spirochaetaceae bacterium]|nr:amidohydrolase family protein [Spirochaetaceae bacterium]